MKVLKFQKKNEVKKLLTQLTMLNPAIKTVVEEKTENIDIILQEIHNTNNASNTKEKEYRSVIYNLIGDLRQSAIANPEINEDIKKLEALEKGNHIISTKIIQILIELSLCLLDNNLDDHNSNNKVEEILNKLLKNINSPSLKLKEDQENYSAESEFVRILILMILLENELEKYLIYS